MGEVEKKGSARWLSPTRTEMTVVLHAAKQCRTPIGFICHSVTVLRAMRDCSSLDPVLGVELTRVLRHSILRPSATHVQRLVLVSGVGVPADP